MSRVDSAQQCVVILCGIPGSGKSTFSKRVLQVAASAHPISRWEAFNQDALKTRDAVLLNASAALQSGSHVIIDRCNFDVDQRRHWVDMAYSLVAAPLILAVVMPHYSNVGVCSRRAEARGNSDGIHDCRIPWERVCNGMARGFVYPSEQEGIHLVVECSSNAELETLAQIVAHCR